MAAGVLAACGGAPGAVGGSQQPSTVRDAVAEPGRPVPDRDAVVARIRAALAATGTYGGTMVTTTPRGRATIPFDFVVGSDGSHRVAHADGWHAFDAGRGELRVYCRSHDTVWTVGGLPLALAGRMPPNGLGALSPSEPGGLARQALELGGSVRAVTHDGRPAWRFEGPLAAGRGADHVVVIVDAASGLGVKQETFRDGQAVGSLRVDRLVVNDPAGLGALDLASPPASAGRMTFDGGSRVLEEGERPGGAFSPGWVPEGFVARDRLQSDEASWPDHLVRSGLFSAVASERLVGGIDRCHTPLLSDGGAAFPPGPDMDPPGPRVVGATYRRGFESFTLSTASYPGGAPRPEPAPGGIGPGWEPLTLGTASDGPVARLTATTPRSGPLLEIWKPNHLVTIAGDLTRAELVAVADSLVLGP